MLRNFLQMDMSEAILLSGVRTSAVQEIMMARLFIAVFVNTPVGCLVG
jgi:hypothetical protein